MNMRTPAAIRLAQAAAIVHGTCLLLAGLMLLAAAEGPHPLLSSADAQRAALVALPLGVAILIAGAYLGRQSQRGLWTLGTLEAVAAVTSLLLTLPLLILMGMAMSGIVASTMLSRHQVQYTGTTDRISAGVRLAQTAGLLHGTCLVIAAGALVEAAGAATPLVSRGDASLDAYVNVPFGAVIVLASLYLARRPEYGRRLLAIAEVGAFVSSLLLHVPLLIVLDIFLSVAVETTLTIARSASPAPPLVAAAIPWPKMPLPWVGVTVVVAFIGFALGGFIATEQTNPNTPLLWVGGVIGGVVFGACAAGFGYEIARRQERRSDEPTRKPGSVRSGPLR